MDHYTMTITLGGKLFLTKTFFAAGSEGATDAALEYMDKHHPEITEYDVQDDDEDCSDMCDSLFCECEY